MIAFAKRMNWLVLALVSLGLIVLAAGRTEVAPILDSGAPYGILPFILAQLAFYFQSSKLVKWLAVSVLSFSLFAFALALLLTSMSPVTENIKWALIITSLSAIPLVINLAALFRISTKQGLHRNSPNTGASGEL